MSTPTFEPTRDANTRDTADNDPSDPDPLPPAAGPGPFVFGPVLKLEGESEDDHVARAQTLREAQLRVYYKRLMTEGPFASILATYAEQQLEESIKMSHWHLVRRLERLCNERDSVCEMGAPSADLGSDALEPGASIYSLTLEASEKFMMCSMCR